MDFEKFIQYRNTSNPFAQNMGIVTVEASLGYAKLTKVITEKDMNPFHAAHGGVYFALADTATGTASATHGRKTVTIDATYHYLRGAGLGDTLTAEAREVKAGRTIGVYSVEVKDQHGRLLGTGDFTYFLAEEPLEF